MPTTSVQLRVFEMFGGSVTNVPFQNFLASVPLIGFWTVIEEISSSRNHFVNLRSSEATPISFAPGIDTRVVMSAADGARSDFHGPSFNPSPRVRRARLAILELNDWGVEIRPADIFVRSLTAHAYFTEWPTLLLPVPDPGVSEFLARKKNTLIVQGPGSAVIDWIGADGEVLLRRHIEVGGSKQVAASGDLPLELETDRGTVPVVPRLATATGVTVSTGSGSLEEFTSQRCRDVGVEAAVLCEARLPDAVQSLVRGSPLSLD